MKHSTPTPNALDKARFEALRSLGCICCRIEGINCVSVEVHHLLSGNRRRGHQFTIGLCPHHHRGASQWPKAEAVRYFGPSLADGSKPFHAKYGSDNELLARTNALLAQNAVAA